MKQLLLQHILSNPDDDLARLAYADWLQEYGSEDEQAQGEFIALQMRIARDEPEYYLSWDNAAREAKSAIETHRHAAALFACMECVLCDFLGYWGSIWGEYRKGFLQTVRAPELIWTGSAYKLLTLHPIRRVELTQKEPCSRDDSSSWWGFIVGGPPIGLEDHLLCVDLFERLAGEGWQQVEPAGLGRDLHTKHYHTKEAAMNALSQACLEYARDKIAAATDQTESLPNPAQTANPREVYQ